MQRCEQASETAWSEGRGAVREAGILRRPGGKASARNAGDPGSVPGSGGSPGEGNGDPVQYSRLEKSVDCIVHGVGHD